MIVEMHTKQASRKSPRRFKTVSFSSEEPRINEIHSSNEVHKKTEFSNTNENWIDEDERRRQHPILNRLSASIYTLLTQDSDLFVSFRPDLPRRVADEVARVSRDEPGGVAAGRVKVYLRSRESYPSNDVRLVRDFNPDSKDLRSAFFSLGTTGLSEGSMVETFEVEVYLFSSDSVLSKLQTILNNFSLSKNEKLNRFRCIDLLPDFVLVKRKLFRSNSKKPLVVVKSMAK